MVSRRLQVPNGLRKTNPRQRKVEIKKNKKLMEEKSIIIGILITTIIVFILTCWGFSGVDKEHSKDIQDCINAGNKPIPCVEAVLGHQNKK